MERMKFTHIHVSAGANIQEGTSLAEESQGYQNKLEK